MENEKLNPQPEENDWFADLMHDPDLDTPAVSEDPATKELLPPDMDDESLAEIAVSEEAAEEEPATEEPLQENPSDGILVDVDHLLTSLDIETEIGADEQAVAAAGLSDISEMELEKIIQEAIAENWEKDDPYGDTAAQESPLVDATFGDVFAELDENTHTSTEDAISNEADIPEDEETDDTPVRKVRPRRKKGYGLFGLPHLASTAIWVAIVLAIGISFGRLLWVCAADILAFGRADQTITITITEHDDLDSIANKLYNAGLIEYPELFKAYAKLANVMEKGKISVGTFELNTLYDYNALVKGMSATSSYRETIKVTIPEGFTCKQIFALLEEKGVCTVKELEAYASENDFSSYWFLADVEKGTPYCLEGYLFPDTYTFYTKSSAKQVYIKLLGRFEDQFDEDLVHYMEVLNEKLGVNMTIKDIITIASMIQKESAHTGENYNISSVIYNRLKSPVISPICRLMPLLSMPWVVKMT
jgi:cell division protein YceG involved in septum cleavage